MRQSVRASRLEGELGGGGGGPESTGGHFGMRELNKVLRSEVVDGLEGEKENL